MGDATKPVDSQCAEMEILSSSTTTTKSLSEAICAPPQSGVEAESSLPVQKQASRVKIRKPSMCPEVKPSPSPDVTAIASIKSAIQLDSGTPSVVEESLLDELEDELELSHTLSDTRDDDDVLLEIEEMINR